MSTGGNPTRKRKYKPKNRPGPDRAEISWKEEEFQNLNSTALDAPPGYITLYAAFFREGNFRLPMMKFTEEVLTNYGLHISQINALELPRMTHFEFICRANRIEPTIEMFNVFYYVSYTGGFYSFNSRTGGVSPCSANPPKNLHDWKQKFFYIHRGAIPIDMHYRPESEGIPRVNVSINFTDQEWYKMALVGAGMSMLWVPQNPRGIPVYGYQGKVGYSLLNVLDPKAAGAMVEAILPEGKPVWLDQIRDRFLHPTSDSFAAYTNTILGEDGGGDFDDSTDPTREEVLSSRLETRKKKKLDKSEKKEKKVEENVTEAPRKQPSNHLFLDYVVVSDTLYGLDAGEKRAERDPDDNATLTEIMEKKRILVEKKKELDEQAATALAAKKSKLQKETPPAPLESEIGLGVFSAKCGNLLEKIYAASGSQGIKSSKAPRKVGEGGGDAHGAGDAGAGGGGGDDDVQEESSEATPHHTIYTKVVRGSGQGGASGTHRSPEYEHVQGGSWDTHNPTCVDLPHAPRWNLTQGSRMTELANCRESFSLSLPPAIAREWQLMGEDTLEFENAKKAFAEEREKFNVEKKGLAWRVADAEEKLAKENQSNVDKQRDWEVACERTNKELQT
ncbi:hypothetical protein Hanom_Chr01g00044511 [Helianthus anomalus]